MTDLNECATPEGRERCAQADRMYTHAAELPKEYVHQAVPGCGATAPTRAVRLTLKLEADTRHCLASALYHMASEIERGRMTTGVSGGCDSGYIYELTESDHPTHDEYFEQLRVYLDRLKPTATHPSEQSGQEGGS